MAREWVTVRIPETLHEQIKRDFAENREKYRQLYGVNSFHGLIAAKLEEGLVFEPWADAEKGKNPLIEDWLLEDLDGFIELYHDELRKYLRMRDLREFTKEALECHMIYLKAVIDRIVERSGGPATDHVV